MGRVPLVGIVRARLRYAFGQTTEPPERNDRATRLARYCIKGAAKMFRLFDMLKQGGRMVRFSFTDFQACSIATTVTLFAGVLEKDSTYEHRVNLGMDCLFQMAAGNTAAISGVEFIEALRRIATEAAFKLEQKMRTESASVYVPQFNDWVGWLSQARRSYAPNEEREGIGASASPFTSSPTQMGPWTRNLHADAAAHNGGVLPPAPKGFPLEDHQDANALSHLPISEDIFSSYVNGDSLILELTGLNVFDLASFST